MSDTTLGSQIVSWISLALAVLGIIVGAINHKRVRSTCFGKVSEVSLDIENTTPKGHKVEAIEVTVPRRSDRLKEKEEQKESVPTIE